MAILVIMLLSGCNYTEYDYDYAIINLEGEYKKISISSWKCYTYGDIIQIRDKQGNTYLTSGTNCILVKGEL